MVIAFQDGTPTGALHRSPAVTKDRFDRHGPMTLPRRRFPWYDAIWLRVWHEARDHIIEFHPERLAEFDGAFEALRTDPDFEAQVVDVIDDATHQRLCDRADELRNVECETHELGTFGRRVVHDDRVFTEVQQALVGAVSDLAGELVRPCYNFLSFYGPDARCPVHLDAPEAKWTVDHCLDRSDHRWPIEVSEVIEWPDGVWGGAPFTRHAAQVPSRSFEHEVGQSMLFSGSAQWHHRASASEHGADFHRTMIFFHYVPVAASDVVDPASWPARFGMDCLSVNYG